MRYLVAAILAAVATVAVAQYCNQRCTTYGNQTVCTIYCDDGSTQTCTTTCYGNTCNTSCY